MATKKTKEEYINELKVKNPDIILTGQYINSKTKTEHYCVKHEIYFNICPQEALRGCGCELCRREKIHNSKAKTEDKYIEDLSVKNPSVQYISGYINADTPALHHCLIHNIDWDIRPTSALRGHGCTSCRVERISSTQRKSKEVYISELNEKNPNLELVGEYINTKTPIRHYCKKHDVCFYTQPIVALQGGGCSQCWKEKLRDLHLKSQDQYVQELKEVNPDIILIGDYVGSEIPTLHECLICGNKWFPVPNSIVNCGCGCPKCNTSKGERWTMVWLDEHNIQYIRQKTFDDCIDKRKLPFDFYLPDYNICIEYQGRQHYEPVDYFGGEEQLLYVQYHDQIKKDYCVLHDIELICIPYWENVDAVLNKNLLI